MRFSSKSLIVLSAFLLAFVFVPASRAQLNSNTATVNLNAKMAESLTVVAGPATVNFTPLAPNGPTNGDNPVAITTTWVLAKGRTSVKLYAYFAGANALTDGVGDNIPVANVTGNVNGGGANPFTSATVFSGATGMTVFTQAIGVAGPFNSSHVDSIALVINTTGLALPAATYTGVLNIEAQAI